MQNEAVTVAWYVQGSYAVAFGLLGLLLLLTLWRRHRAHSALARSDFTSES